MSDQMNQARSHQDHKGSSGMPGLFKQDIADRQNPQSKFRDTQKVKSRLISGNPLWNK